MPSLVTQTMRQWLSVPQNLTRMNAAYRQKGGWEGWAQVEIAIALTAIANSTVEREQAIYKNNPAARADVVLTISNIHLEVLELKCHGIYRGTPAFVKAVQDDIDKVQNGTYNVTDVRAWAMVFVIDPAVKATIKTAMEAKRRAHDTVTEDQFAIPNTVPVQYVYLLSFILPIDID